MFDTKPKQYVLPNPPYPKHDKCNGTLVPVLIPTPYIISSMNQDNGRTGLDTQNPSIHWRCSNCGKQI